MELYASTIGVGTGGLRGTSLPLPLFFAKLDMTIRIEDNLFFWRVDLYLLGSISLKVLYCI